MNKFHIYSSFYRHIEEKNRLEVIISSSGYLLCAILLKRLYNKSSVHLYVTFSFIIEDTYFFLLQLILKNGK